MATQSSTIDAMDLFPLSRSLPRLLEGRDTVNLAEWLGVAESTLTTWRRRPPKMLQKLETLVRLCGYRAILVPIERSSDEPPDLEALVARVEELESIVTALEKMFDLEDI